MSRERNYWQRMRHSRMSRRAMLSASARAGVGAAGLALVGCGDDDDDDAATAQVAQQAQQQAQQAQQQAQQQQAEPQAQQQAQQEQQAQAEQQAEQQAQQAQAQEQAEQEQAQEQAVAQAMGPTPTAGGIRYDRHNQSSFTLDPHRTSDQNGVWVTAWVTDKVVRELNSNTGELIGDLAETWETPDAGTTVLNVRQGVKWQSQGPGARNPNAAAGRDFTPADLRWNFERQGNNLLVNGDEAGFPRSSIYANAIAGGIDEDATSLTLHYGRPDATVLSAWGTEMFQIGQRELMESIEDDPFDFQAQNMIGTGPYVLTDIESAVHWAVRRNPDYWGEPGLLDGAFFNSGLAGDPNATRLAFENKSTDEFSTSDAELINAVEGDNEGDVYRISNGSAGPFGLLVNPIFTPWDDPRNVMALHLAYDRHAYIQFYNAGAAKLNGPIEWVQTAWAVPQDKLLSLPGHRSGALRDEDLKEANAMWDAGGGRDFGEIEIPFAQGYISSRGSDASEIHATTINDALNTDQFVGTVSTWAEMIPELFAREFFTYSSLYIGFIGADPRVDLHAHFHSAGTQNHFSTNNAELDTLLDASLAETDRESAIQLVQDAQDLILDNAHFGRIQGHNGISTRLLWNYIYKAAEPGVREEGLTGFTFRFHSLEARGGTWIDESDPTFSGRPDIQPGPI